MNSLPTNQSNAAIYNWLAEIQSVFSQYIMMRNQLRTLDDRLRVLNDQFDKFPTQQNFYAVQNFWSQKFPLMQQISNIVNNIISSLTEANNPSLLSNIEIKSQMMRLSLPNFDNLKRLIRGY